MLKKILIATDGSETSMLAADLALGIGKRAGARVIAVYVIDVHRMAQIPGYAAMPGMKDRLMEIMIKEGNEALGEIGDKARDMGVASESWTEQGDPGEELLKLCLDGGFDLIVLGCIGRSGLQKLLLGSVAERVLRHASIPVLVVPARAEGKA